MDKNKHLFDGETLAYSAQGDIKNLYITNKRVICTTKGGNVLNNSTFKDISISHISSIEWKNITYPWALVVGIISIIGGVGSLNVGDYNILTTILVTIGAILILVYLFYKKSGMVIITDCEKIPLTFGGYDAEKNVSEMTKIIREMDAKNE